jgi:hypothetical protein
VCLQTRYRARTGCREPEKTDEIAAIFFQTLVKSLLSNTVSNSLEWLPDLGSATIIFTANQAEDNIFGRGTRYLNEKLSQGIL